MLSGSAVVVVGGALRDTQRLLEKAEGYYLEALARKDPLLPVCFGLSVLAADDKSWQELVSEARQRFARHRIPPGFPWPELRLSSVERLAVAGFSVHRTFPRKPDHHTVDLGLSPDAETIGRLRAAFDAPISSGKE